MIAALFDGYFWHPLTGLGYQLWSGIVSDLGEYTIAISVVAGFVAWYRRHNCHVYRCWRLQWHVHPTTGHPVCHHHHPVGRIVHDPDRPHVHVVEEEK